MNRTRWFLVVAMSLVGLAGALWASRQGAGWPAAAGLTAVEVGLAVAVAVWRRDALLGRLALFGLVAGLRSCRQTCSPSGSSRPWSTLPSP